MDCIIDGGNCDYGLESTIIKPEDGVIKLLRPGAVTVEMLALFDRPIYVDPAVTDFYAFTANSFSLEGYTPAPFEDKIPIAV